MKIKGKRTSVEVSTSSQSDIAFLLIIFFLVSTSFAVKTGLSLDVPKKNATPVKVFEKEVGQIRVSKDFYQFGSQRVSKTGIESAVQNFDYDKIIVKVDYGVPYGRVASLISFLQEHPVTLSIRMEDK